MSECPSLSEIATIENAARKLRSQSVQREKEIVLLKENIVSLEKRYEKEKNEQSKHINDLQSINERLRHENCEQKDQIQNLKTALSNLKTEIEHKNKVISDHKKDCETIRKERDKTNASLQNLEKEKQDLLKRLKISTKQESQLKSEIEKLKTINDENREQITKLEQNRMTEQKTSNNKNETNPLPIHESETWNRKFVFGLHRDTFSLKERKKLKDRIHDLEEKVHITENLYSEQHRKHEVLEGRFKTQAQNFKKEENMLYNTIEANKREIEQLQKDIEVEKQNTSKAEKRVTALTNMEEDNEILRNALELITKEYKSSEKRMLEKEKGNLRMYHVDGLILMNRIKEICNSIQPTRLQSMCNTTNNRKISVKNITVNHIYSKHNHETTNRTEEVVS